MRKQIKLTDVSDYAVWGSNSFRSVCDIYRLERRHDNKTVQKAHICKWMFALTDWCLLQLSDCLDIA
jgi:hypothetical protein